MRHIQEGIHSSGLKYMRNTPAAGARFVLVVLHGWGRCMTHLFDLFLQVDAALPVIAVQAPYRMGPGAYRWFGYQPGSSVDILLEEWRSSARRLAALIEDLHGAEPTCPICIAGHSQGAMMSLCTALERPDLVERCVSISGRLLPPVAARLAAADPALFAGKHFLIVHGSLDCVVPAHHGPTTRDRLQRTAATVTFAPYRGGHEVGTDIAEGVVAWLARGRVQPKPGESA